MQREVAYHRLRGAAGTAEADQPIAEQDDAADMAIVAVLGILEAKRALDPEPPVLAPAQAHAGRMHRLVQPLHAGGLAGVAADLGGALRRGARRKDA